MRFLTFILTALILTCIQSPTALAQSHNHSRCNSDHRMQQIYDQNPDYRQEVEEGRRAVMQKMQNNPNFNSRAGDIITIPVHVIIVHPTGEAIGQGSNLSMSKIESQITVLNEDFRRTNADAVNTPNVFSVSDAEIEFCLASVDPNGNATNGVTRYASNQNFDNNESSIKSQTGWNRDDYLNIWVAPTVGALGYAYLPSTSSLPNATLDGVVIVTTTFGGPNTGSNAPYDLGRTTTHEVGHYLGLDHIWGGGCNQDDGIADTPQQASDNGGCPNHPSPSCNNGGDMFMNYMDYVNDLCMNAFSAGQNTYMRQILNTSRSSLLTSANTKCNLIINPPTCTDGIQNGNETGVDCGGADCPACEVAATCTDGIQNGNETGIDCGGTDCPACEVAATCNDGIQNGGETGIDCGGTDCPACETEPTCSAPGNISIFGANENSATVTWGAVNGAVSYNLQYKSGNSIDWTNISTTGTSLTIGNLQSCTQYQVRIQSVCADGGSSKLAYAETTLEEVAADKITTSNDNTQATTKKQAEPAYTEGEILVQLQPKTPLNQFLKNFQSYKGKSTGLKLKKVVSKSLDIYLFEFNPSKAKHADFSSQIFHHKDVRIVQNNHKVTLRNTPNDSQFNEQWQYINTGQSGGTVGADIDADLAWDITTGGTNTDGDEIVVCVIDDGLDENHPDFGDNVWINTNEIPNNNIDDDGNGYVDDYKGWNTYQNNDNLNDPGHWHGTPVAGIVGAKGNNGTGVTGVNWNVKIMFVVGGGNEAEAIAAYTYPLEMRKLYNETNGAKGAFVVSTNASWGIDGGKASDAPLWCNMYEQLGAQGILSAGATANANTNVDVDGDLPTQCSSDYLIAVTNMNHNDQKVTEAGYGATSIDLGAFGADAYNVAINNSYEGFGGTSGATPHVAGTIALLYSAPCSNFTALSKNNPGAAALAVRNYILNGTDSNTSLQGITTSGGRLNIHKALQELMNANCSGATPTCNDGIQNGGETGVDCGGNCSPCETTATCDDGIQNGNETGVDCGGDCSPCGETITSVYSAPISFTTSGCVSCTDGIQNGNETGIDCGGDCSPCGGNNDYCDATGQDTEYEWIETVNFVSINNTSGANAGYGDFTNQVTSVEQASTHGIVLTPGFSSGAYDEYFQVWIDYNQDGDFDDAGELAFDAGNASSGVVTGTIAIPADAAVGSTRMRVAMRWNEAPDGPCGVFGFGEVEDYTVTITAAPTCDDGIQNGNETGVDCGGDCTPCIVATCDDGIQNGNETGIDCGGSCAPCGGGNDGEYCDSYGEDSSFEYISEVAVGDYYFSSGDDNGYADNTDIIFEAAQGSSTDLQLTPEFLEDAYPEYWQVYVDFNQDGDFDDAGELAFDSGSASTSAVNGKLTVPSTATLGITTMRVQMSWESGYDDPCALIEYGEVEDYGLEITEEEEEVSTCDAPTDSWVTKIQNTKVRLNWDAMPDAIKYKIRYRSVYGTDNWVYKSTSNTFRNLTPLLAGTEYEYQIRTKCPNGWTAYSEVEYFSTAANKESSTPIAATETIDVLEMSLKAYPNPADTHVQIEVTNLSQEATLSIFNLAGKLMYQEAIGGDAKLQLDISGYQNGFYILQLEDGQHSKTEKLAVF